MNYVDGDSNLTLLFQISIKMQQHYYFLFMIHCYKIVYTFMTLSIFLLPPPLSFIFASEYDYHSVTSVTRISQVFQHCSLLWWSYLPYAN
jgi:hypothetical protein